MRPAWLKFGQAREARLIRDCEAPGPNGREGLIIKKYSGFYYIQGEEEDLLECRIRGKIKFEVLSGDRVIYSALGKGRGVIEKVLPRLNQLERPRVANVSLALIIMACSEPVPSLMLLDRLLVSCQYNRIRPLIILNKMDLESNPASRTIGQNYPQAGFEVIAASAETGQGIEQIRLSIINEIAVLTGPSGVGKSSILNAVLESPEAATQALSIRLRRGKHTTRHVELYPLLRGGWLVDTPGFSMLEMPPMKKHELPGFYPDFSPYTGECRFRNCLHYKENQCGVRQALARGEIIPERYDNYIYMLEEIMENERRYQ